MQEYEEKIAKLKKIIGESGNIVFFGGAGVSTESGIPDFRSRDGLYHEEYDYPPETIVSHEFFMGNTAEFYRFYKRKMLFPHAEPNACHLALARLERAGKLKAVVTQNIDGLHQKAGSKSVFELHGSVWRNFCTKCKKSFSLAEIIASDGVPRCSCGGIVKPDVVLYEESLNEDVMARAIHYIRQADVLIIGGTSLVVYPAAGLVQYYRGSKLAVVNKGATTPKVDTTKNGKNAVAGENVITLNNLTAGAREIYIVVKNAGGVESAALKVDIPAFGGGTEQPGEFKITISAPKGGTLTASKTTAGAGDTITVTATPDAGMQLVAGSLTYTLAVAGGETKKIDNFTFTMPAGDVSLTCKWETKSTTVDGITGFSINGVSGSINQTNGTISVVMPYGTDVSKLVPVISGNNIASIIPGSGVMQDFSKPVTYTVTLADGTTKTYTVTVYVQSGTAADQMWGKLTDFYNQVPWWKYAEHQQSYGKYPRYW